MEFPPTSPQTPLPSRDRQGAESPPNRRTGNAKVHGTQTVHGGDAFAVPLNGILEISTICPSFASLRETSSRGSD